MHPISLAEKQELRSRIEALNKNFNLDDLDKISNELWQMRRQYSLQLVVDWLTGWLNQSECQVIHGLLARIFCQEKAFDFAKVEALKADEHFPNPYWHDLVSGLIVSSVLEKMQPVSPPPVLM
jgi:hypothetical protein